MVKIREALMANIRHIVGVLSLAAVIVGVWGLTGWEWAIIAAGAVPAAFYLFGEARAASMPGAPE